MGNVPLGTFDAAERTRFIFPLAPELTCEVVPEGSPVTANFTLGAVHPFAAKAAIPRADELLA